MRIPFLYFFVLNVACIVRYSQSQSDDTDEYHEVIVGGAGASGLGVAYTLQKEGNISDFVILEGKDYIGGKIKAIEIGDTAVETGAGYVSGGVDNPFYCEMEKLESGFAGYEWEWTVEVNDLWGKTVDKGAFFRMTYAHDEASWYARNCLWPEKYDKLPRKQKKYCNALCAVNTTAIPGSGVGGILDLEETDHNICNHTGVFRPGDDLDMSVTDMMRVAGFFAPEDPAGTCVARVSEYTYLDKEIAHTPWTTSAKHWFTEAVFGYAPDFGESRDFYVRDPRGYIYLLKKKVAEVLLTSEETAKDIVLDDDRVRLNSKITKVRWDPAGKEAVVVTYCKTIKRSEYDHPCADAARTEIRARDFVSTFSFGVLKRSLELERHPISEADDVAPTFDPPLSSVPGLARVLDASDMGTLTKVFMEFECRFWNDTETFLLPYTKEDFSCDYLPLGFSLDASGSHAGANIFAVAAAGPRAEALSRANTTREIHDQVLPVLNRHFREGIHDCGRTELTSENILSTFVTDWFGDPQSRGCWYAPPLAGAATEFSLLAALLAEGPQFGNLHLSGEGTCERHKGWVPGAWFSGERTAKILLKNGREGFGDLDTRTLCDVDKSEMTFHRKTCEWKPQRPRTKSEWVKTERGMVFKRPNWALHPPM